ncbi:sulfatase [Chloroflexota bacterium]
MNIIIVMIDTLRPDHMGCYGNKWIKTPNLDKLAQESMVFDRAVPESLPTIPVRRALFTGMRVFPFDKPFFPSSWEQASAAGAKFSAIDRLLQPGWEPIPWDQATLAEMLQGWMLAGVPQVGLAAMGVAKYRTALISDTAPYFSSPAMNYQRGFAHFDFIRGHETDAYGIPVLAKKLDMDRFMPPWYKGTIWAKLLEHYLANTAHWRNEEDHFAPRTFKAAIKWLEDSQEATDPFFLCVDEWDPHEPFDPPQEYVELYDPGYDGIEMIEPFYGPTSLMTEKELNHMRALYAGKVTMVDTWFGKFMDKVRELGLLDNTFIVVTSDHGHQLGEHGISGKVPAGAYNELMDCVLIIRHPQGIGAGQTSNALVQHQDICTTIMNLVGEKPPYELDGKDLMPILEGKIAKVRDYATCGHVLNVWCRDDDYVLICRTTGEEPQLFDMKNDPDQLQNIAADKPNIVKQMYDLILVDAKGGPILPNYKLDIRAEGDRTHDWSPFREFQMPKASE